MTGAFVGSLAALFIVPIPDPNRQVIVYMLGQLSGFVAAIVATYFVKPHDQAEKDQRRQVREDRLIDLAAGVPTPSEMEAK